MANDRVVSKKIFGNKGLVIPGREPSIKTNGGLMYYSYDGMRNVTELTERQGDGIEQYRYDAFGGLYTGITAPYNTNGFAGMSYDPKANLIDNNARWYQAQTGRFTSADPYRGELLTPYTQNRYAYVGNNPINRWDPLGYWMAGDENLSDDAYERIRELTEEWDNATTQEDRDRIHGEANDVRNQDRNGGNDDDDDDTGGSGGSSDDDDDDDDDDEDYERPLRAKDWYQQNKSVLGQYSKPETQAPSRSKEEKLAIINKYMEDKAANNSYKQNIQQKELDNKTSSKNVNGVVKQQNPVAAGISNNKAAFDNKKMQGLLQEAGVGVNANKGIVKPDITTRVSSIVGGSFMAYVGAAAVIAGATAFTIATGGAGLPALIAATVAAGTMVSGAGLAVMGANEVAYGVTGKNVVLDKVFKGNADLYSNTQLALTMGTYAGMQYSSAYSYQETTFRNGFSEAAKGAGKAASSGGRLGSAATRAQNGQIASYLESEGWDIAGGGGRLREEYFPGLGGGTKGSNYVDITAIKNGQTIRINTVDTYKNGQMTTREANAANLINLKTGGNIITIPKGTGLGNLPDMLK